MLCKPRIFRAAWVCLAALLGEGAVDTVRRGPGEEAGSLGSVGANAHIGPRNGFSILRNGFSILRMLCKPRIVSIVRNLLSSIFGEGAEDTVGRGLGPAEGTVSIETVGADAHIRPCGSGSGSRGLGPSGTPGWSLLPLWGNSPPGRSLQAGREAGDVLLGKMYLNWPVLAFLWCYVNRGIMMLHVIIGSDRWERGYCRAWPWSRRKQKGFP